MNFFEANKSAISKYRQISGRAARSEYWYFHLLVFIFGFFLSATNNDNYFIACFLPSITVCIRRLHDINKSGWWMLILLVPIIGVAKFFEWMCKKGGKGENRFGPDPLAPDPLAPDPLAPDNATTNQEQDLEKTEDERIK